MIKQELLQNAFKPRIGNVVRGVVRNGLEYAPEKIPDDHIFVGDGFTDSGLRYVIAVSIEDFEKMFGDAVGDDGAFDFEKMVNIDKEKRYGFGQYIGSLKREVGNASQPR